MFEIIRVAVKEMYPASYQQFKLSIRGFSTKLEIIGCHGNILTEETPFKSKPDCKGSSIWNNSLLRHSK
jgi:hypothetical protein